MTTKSFRILLAIWNFDKNLSFEHWDVKTAFVNAPLQEVVYCRQVPGFEKSGHEKHVLLLKKALYGTKQGANAWQKFLAEILLYWGRKHPKDEKRLSFSRRGGVVIFGNARR